MRTMIKMKRGGWLGLALILGATVPAALAQQPTSPSYPVYQVTSAPAPTAASPAPAATPVPPPSAPAQRSAADLQKLAEPIALYPDPLISIVLPSAVYPLEVVQAARFVKNTNNIPKVDDQPWDENVKSVAKFPEVIAKMDADLSWTADLGAGVCGPAQGIDGCHPDPPGHGAESRHAPDHPATGRDGDQHRCDPDQRYAGRDGDQPDRPDLSRQPAGGLCAGLSAHGLLPAAGLRV